MSNYNLKAKNKKTGEVLNFLALDDYYGNHNYGYQKKIEDENTILHLGDVMDKKEFNELYEPIEDPNHPYGGLEVLDNVPPETMQDRFNKEFVDEDTGLLNISKYDHERLLKFINTII